MLSLEYEVCTIVCLYEFKKMLYVIFYEEFNFWILR